MVAGEHRVGNLPRISPPPILAEWLSTGQGLGDLMVTSSSTANYSMLWSAVVAITAVSVLIYNVVSAIERPVVARLGTSAI